MTELPWFHMNEVKHGFLLADLRHRLISCMKGFKLLSDVMRYFIKKASRLEFRIQICAAGTFYLTIPFHQRH